MKRSSIFLATKRTALYRLGSSQLLLLMIALLLPLSAAQAQTTYQAEAGALGGAARIATCSACSGGKKVGFIGKGAANTVTLTVNAPTAGSYHMTLYYLVNGTRSFSISVNGGTASTVSLSGTSFSIPVASAARTVTLKAGSNSIKFGNSTAYAPDLDRIVIAGSAPTPTPTPTPTATPKPTATPTPTATPVPSGKVVAPYMDISFGQDVPSVAQQAGLKYVTFAFVIDNGSNCQAGWGGVGAVSSDSTFGGYITRLRQAGGDAIISFGGAAGNELALDCSSNTSLENQYNFVVNKYSARRLDFDVEGNAINNTSSINRRNQVLAAMKAANPGLIISYTLPVNPTGLDSTGINVLQSAMNAGLRVDIVNIMAMDYNNDNANMGSNAVMASDATVQQMQQIGMNAKLGITPMIGENDTQPEVFTLSNAQTVASYANSHGNVALLSFWSLNRDHSCPGGGVVDTCSGLSQSDFQFSHIFEQF